MSCFSPTPIRGSGTLYTCFLLSVILTTLTLWPLSWHLSKHQYQACSFDAQNEFLKCNRWRLLALYLALMLFAKVSWNCFHQHPALDMASSCTFSVICSHFILFDYNKSIRQRTYHSFIAITLTFIIFNLGCFHDYYYGQINHTWKPKFLIFRLVWTTSYFTSFTSETVLAADYKCTVFFSIMASVHERPMHNFFIKLRPALVSKSFVSFFTCPFTPTTTSVKELGALKKLFLKPGTRFF